MTGDQWRTLTPPQPIPDPDSTGKVSVNGASIHYARYGADNSRAVLLLHGGLGAAEDFGGQISAIAEKYLVIAIDTRGHGRSTDDDQPYGYELLASDVTGVMDALGIDKAAIIGWSDGGNIGLHLAVNDPDRLTRVFALGANYNTSAIRPSAFFRCIGRCLRRPRGCPIRADFTDTGCLGRVFRKGVRDVGQRARVYRRTIGWNHHPFPGRCRGLRRGYRRSTYQANV